MNKPKMPKVVGADIPIFWFLVLTQRYVCV